MQTDTIASLTTAAGTLVLAVATFASTRSANRSSRLAEQSLLAGLQPVLIGARLDDPRQKIGFQDGHWVAVEGAMAAAEEDENGAIYLVLPVRNAGSGVAVIQGWHPVGEQQPGGPHQPVEEFRMHARDMFIAPGELGFWQAAVRDVDDPDRESLSSQIRDRERVSVDVLYSDIHGGQRAISRFSFMPAHDRWLSSVSRHWVLDGTSPR
ncbi:MAG: hypothetical protein JWM12_3985 [Ilumatobacteraceae bacterium]|nr:hypothetical protein [Ilumatobacteraceae bacterium]